MWRSLIAATAVVLAAFSANGEPTPSTPYGSRVPVPGLVGADVETGSTKSGCTIAATWEEIRQGAAANGVELSVVYDGEGLVNTNGGVRTGAVYLGNLHLQLTDALAAASRFELSY